MGCPAETILAEAASNGSLLPQNARYIRAAILASRVSALGLAVDKTSVLARAKAGGISGFSKRVCRILQAQMLCNALNTVSGGIPCMNVIPAGAQYGTQSKTGNQYVVTLVVGAQYLLTWGANEVSAKTGTSTYPNTGAGTTTNFIATSSTLILYASSGYVAVTAALCIPAPVVTPPPAGITISSVTPNPISTFNNVTLTIHGSGFKLAQVGTITIVQVGITDGPYTTTFVDANTLTIAFVPAHEFHGAADVNYYVSGVLSATLGGGIIFS